MGAEEFAGWILVALEGRCERAKCENFEALDISELGTLSRIWSFGFRISALLAKSEGWAHQDSNLGPRDYESPALTAELQAQFHR